MHDEPIEVVVLDGASIVGDPEGALRALIDAQPSDNLAAASHAEFDSLDAIKARVDRAAEGKSTNRDRADTFSGLSFDEMVRRLRDGWIEGGERAQELVTDVVTDVEQELRLVDHRRRARVWSENGDEVDYDRVREGRVDKAWRSSRRIREGRAPIITVVVPWGGGYRMSAETLFWRGAAGIAVAVALERIGYNVEIVAMSRNTQRDPNGYGAEVAKAIRVKEPDRPLRVETIASLMCDAAIYRVYGWAALLACESKILPGLGRHRHLTADLDLEHSGEPLRLEGEAVVIGDVFGRADAQSEVMRVLKDVAEFADDSDADEESYA